jgi:glycosyltransferase involved in cell wall biosynthesis
MKVLHFGAYWQKENDIIFAMVKDLAKVSNALVVDTHLYDDKKSDYVTEDFSYNNTKPVRWLRDDVVDRHVKTFEPDVVVVNAGGMSLSRSMFSELRRRRIKTVGISLSDPDVFPYNGSIYANLFDYYYTNSLFSYHNQYKEGNIDILPFAASCEVHQPLDIPRRHDIIIVGGYRPDRKEAAALLSHNFNVGIYGKGWPDIGATLYGNVNGLGHLIALNSGMVYISFSKTGAGYTNVKVGLFEAAACGLCLVTEDFPEVYNYFEKDREIVTYADNKELLGKLSSIINNKSELESISNSSYRRYLAEHTWENRWTKVLSKTG